MRETLSVTDRAYIINEGRISAKEHLSDWEAIPKSAACTWARVFRWYEKNVVGRSSLVVGSLEGFLCEPSCPLWLELFFLAHRRNELMVVGERTTGFGSNHGAVATQTNLKVSQRQILTPGLRPNGQRPRAQQARASRHDHRRNGREPRPRRTRRLRSPARRRGSPQKNPRPSPSKRAPQPPPMPKRKIHSKKSISAPSFRTTSIPAIVAPVKWRTSSGLHSKISFPSPAV